MKATSGDLHLGGVDFDQRMVELVLDLWLEEGPDSLVEHWGDDHPTGAFEPSRLRLVGTLKGTPTLLEPVYVAEIRCPETAVGGIYNVINSRGKISEEQRRAPLCSSSRGTCRSESSCFTADPLSHTSGQAFSQCAFDHGHGFWRPRRRQHSGLCDRRADPSAEGPSWRRSSSRSFLRGLKHLKDVVPSQ